VKTRNVRARQWERYVDHVKGIPGDRAKMSMGNGYAVQVDRRKRRSDRRARKRLVRATIKRLNREPEHPAMLIARAFDVPVRLIL
jgi:hypothetical protein